MNTPHTIIIAGIAAILVGFILVFAGTAMQSSSPKNEIKSGGVILIGPIPIIFGNDKSTIVITVLLAIILMILAYFLFYRKIIIL